MPDRSGWVKIHRSMLEHPLTGQLPAAWFRIWVVVLMSTNWKPGVWWDGKKEVSIPAGSFVISLDKLASKSGSGVQQVRSALDYFEATRMITRRATHSYTTITIVNWSAYQEDEQMDNAPANMADNEPVTRQITQRQHSGNTAVTTIEEGKNKRKEHMSKSGDLDSLQVAVSPKPKTRPASTEIDPDTRRWFDDKFWPLYPRHEAKVPALQAASKKATTPEKRAFYIERLTDKLPAYLQRKAESGQRMIPLASTWFNQDRAEDELPVHEPSTRGARHVRVENDYPEYVPLREGNGKSSALPERSAIEAIEAREMRS
jgi:hypothetical protein